jgi:hypothetical protein
MKGGLVVAVEEVWYPEKPPRQVSWLSFAAALLVVSGIFKIFDALWAFKYDDEVTEVQTVLFERDLVPWGWVWLVVGIFLIAAGFAVVKGAEWARWFGIIVAGVTAIMSFQWIYFQPLWTILSVGLCVAVIFPLAAYGGRRGVLGTDQR